MSGPLEKLWGGWGIFEPHEFFGVNIFLVSIFLGDLKQIFFRVNWRAWLFFPFNLPCANIFLGRGGGLVSSFLSPRQVFYPGFPFLNMKMSLFCLSKYRTHEHSILFHMIRFRSISFGAPKDFVRCRWPNCGKWKFCSILFAGHKMVSGILRNISINIYWF